MLDWADGVIVALHVGMAGSRVARWHLVAELRTPAAKMAALTEYSKIFLLPRE